MSTGRDFALARLGVCRVMLSQAIETLDETTMHFLDGGEEDSDGKERLQLLDDVEEAIGEGARACRAAQQVMSEFSREDWRGIEPDVEEGDGFDEVEAAEA